MIAAIADLYPGSLHVRDVGLQAASDAAVWEHASRHSMVIVSKDADFHQRSFLLGPPPKVIWIRRGNCSTTELLKLLRAHQSEISAFAYDKESAFLALE